VGAAILLAAIVLWTKRRRLAARSLPGATRRSGPGLALGAGSSLVELPTAFPTSPRSQRSSPPISLFRSRLHCWSSSTSHSSSRYWRFSSCWSPSAPGWTASLGRPATGFSASGRSCSQPLEWWSAPGFSVRARSVLQVLDRSALGCGRVEGDGGANESLERLLVYLLALVEVDGAPDVPAQAGIE